VADDQPWTSEELDAWFDSMGFPDDPDFLDRNIGKEAYGVKLGPDDALNADLRFARDALAAADTFDATTKDRFGRLGIEAKTRFRKGIEQLPPTHHVFDHLDPEPHVDGAAFDETGPGEDILTSTGWGRRILLPVVVGTGLVIGTVAVVVALNNDDDDAPVESVATDTETTQNDAEADEPDNAPVVDEPATEEAAIPAEPEAAPAQSWGQLPDSENLIFRGVSLDLPDCPVGQSGEVTLELDFFASSRGAAGSMFGDLDGRMYAGDGVVEMVDGASRTTVNGVATTEQSFYEVIETTADGLTVEVRTYVIDGEVDGDIDPAQATCSDGALVELTSDDPTTWTEFFADTPALDMEVGEIEDWSCTASDSGVSVFGLATVLPPGTDLLVGGEVSGTETVSIPPVTTRVLDDGTFDVLIPGVAPNDLSIQASHGVYGLGGEFFVECPQ
jgi:hypothetical protein